MGDRGRLLLHGCGRRVGSTEKIEVLLLCLWGKAAAASGDGPIAKAQGTISSRCSNNTCASSAHVCATLTVEEYGIVDRRLILVVQERHFVARPLKLVYDTMKA